MGSEAISEMRRHVRDIENSLQVTVKENQAKLDDLIQSEDGLRSQVDQL